MLMFKNRYRMETRVTKRSKNRVKWAKEEVVRVIHSLIRRVVGVIGFKER